MLACLLGLVIGRKKPELFKSVFKKEDKGIFKDGATKKNISIFFGIYAFIFFVLFGVMNDSDKPTPDTTIKQPVKSVQAPVQEKPAQSIIAAQPAENAETAADIEKNKIEEYNANLTKKIEEIKTFKNQDKSTMTSLTAELVIMGSWVGMVKDAKSKNEETSKSFAVSLEKAISQTQIREFPLMRQAYAKMMKEKMWESNMEVSISGTASKVLDLQWYAFANNATIKSTHDTLGSMMRALRFTRVNYKWSEYSKYTYFDLDTSKDSAVESITF